MTSLLRNCFSCLSTTGSGEANLRPSSAAAVERQLTKIYFGNRIHESFKRDAIPSQLKDLLIYIARDGVLVSDLFRRPGNPNDMRNIINDLQIGQKIDWQQYNFFTLANVAKKFLLAVKGGILGVEVEAKLIDTLNLQDDQARIEAMHKILKEQSLIVQQLLTLLFGIWFRMIYHTHVNAMSVEAVAKSVAGSVFPSCTSSPEKVELASKVMEQLITGFASPDLFGHDLIQYFAEQTQTSLSRTEKFVYECEMAPFLSEDEFQDLFNFMLVEESRKHGFDIHRHEVNYEEFVEHSKKHHRSYSRSLPLSEVHQTSEIVTRMTLSASMQSPNGDVLHLPEMRSQIMSTPVLQHRRGIEPIADLVDDSNYSNDHQNNSSLVRFNKIREGQESRMEKRSAWFLSPPSGLNHQQQQQQTKRRMDNEQASHFVDGRGVGGGGGAGGGTYYSDNLMQLSQPNVSKSQLVSTSGLLDNSSMSILVPPLSPSSSSRPVLLRTRYFIVERFYGNSDTNSAINNSNDYLIR